MHTLVERVKYRNKENWGRETDSKTKRHIGREQKKVNNVNNIEHDLRFFHHNSQGPSIYNKETMQIGNTKESLRDTNTPPLCF